MVVIDIGYGSIILPREEAMKMIEILEKAERYERKYWNSEERTRLGLTEDYTYHVYPNDTQYSMHIVGDDLYQMARLAGKPEKLK